MQTLCYSRGLGLSWLQCSPISVVWLLKRLLPMQSVLSSWHFALLSGCPHRTWIYRLVPVPPRLVGSIVCCRLVLLSPILMALVASVLPLSSPVTTCCRLSSWLDPGAVIWSCHASRSRPFIKCIHHITWRGGTNKHTSTIGPNNHSFIYRDILNLNLSRFIAIVY